jgi:hypothetical protein
MLASVALFYAVVILGLSADETLVAAFLYAALALAWLLVIRHTFGARRG